MQDNIGRRNKTPRNKKAFEYLGSDEKERGKGFTNSSYFQGLGTAGSIYSGMADRPTYKTDTKLNVEDTGAQKGMEQAFGSNPITGAFMGIGKGIEAVGDEMYEGVGEGIAAPHKGYLRTSKTGDFRYSVPVYGSVLAAKDANLIKEREGERRRLQEQSLEGRGFVNESGMNIQAEYGMKMEHGGVVNIEKGEVVTDKNYNVKHISKGPTHENGGENVKLKDGDIVFPTQNDKDRSNVLSKIKRYKFNGQGKAELDKMKAELPINEDMAQDGTVYQPEGESGEYKVVGDKYFYRKEKGKGDWQEQKSSKSISAIKERINSEEKSNNSGQVITSPSVSQENAGMTSAQTDNLSKNLDKEVIAKNNYDHWQDNLRGFDMPEYKADQPNLYNTINKDLQTRAPYSDTPNMNVQSDLAQSNIESSNSSNNRRSKFGDILGDVVEGFSKYSNVLHNLKRGKEELSGVNRRFQYPEEFDYVDRSSRDRNAALEAMRSGQIRGKGLSASQSTAYNRALGNQYANRMMDINQGELRRRDVFDQQNVQMRNQAGMTNLQLANQYDTIDRQQKATRDAYTDTAYSELSEQQRFDTLDRSMKERNRRQYEMDRKTLPLLGTQDYRVTEDEDGFKVNYRRGQWQ